VLPVSRKTLTALPFHAVNHVVPSLGSSVRPPSSIFSSVAPEPLRLSTALMRDSSSRGENGLVT
jgi:hypothetical protein